MTCIVGLEHNGQVTIGGDSAGVNTWSLDRQVRSDTKVFRAGPYLCGFTTSFRMGQVLRYHLDLAEPDTWDVDRFMATTFIDAVRDALKTAGWASVQDGTEQGGTFLVGIVGRLYAVESDYQVGRSVDGYASVGSGAPYALGSLATSSDPLRSWTPQARVRDALAAAAKHNAGVCGPFLIESTGSAA